MALGRRGGALRAGHVAGSGTCGFRRSTVDFGFGANQRGCFARATSRLKAPAQVFRGVVLLPMSIRHVPASCGLRARSSGAGAHLPRRRRSSARLKLRIDAGAHAGSAHRRPSAAPRGACAGAPRPRRATTSGRAEARPALIRPEPESAVPLANTRRKCAGTPAQHPGRARGAPAPTRPGPCRAGCARRRPDRRRAPRSTAPASRSPRAQGTRQTRRRTTRTVPGVSRAVARGTGPSEIQQLRDEPRRRPARMACATASRSVGSGLTTTTRAPA